MIRNKTLGLRERVWLKFAIPMLLGLSNGLLALAADDAASLRKMDQTLAQQLSRNQFQRRMVLVSVESPTMLKGDIYAELNYPFATVSGALNDPVQGPAHWCDVLILHLNTKYCHASTGSTLKLSIGKKVEQELADAEQIQFHYSVIATRPDYFKVDLNAASGPLSTKDYDIALEAVAIKGNRTFLHLSYAYRYGLAGRMAMRSYLATVGSRKIGFSVVNSNASPQPEYIGGVRGLVERNAMRYYLAIDAYLGALSSPPEMQLQQRLTKWFNATEQYPRQLHEIDRNDYMRMKRSEYKRQQTAQ